MGSKKLTEFLQAHSKQQHLSPTDASRAFVKRWQQKTRQEKKDSKKSDSA